MFGGGHAIQVVGLDGHTKTGSIRLHHADLDADGRFARADEIIDTSDEPDHQQLCDREQAYFLRAIRDGLDLLANPLRLTATLRD